jgi:tRNA(Ile)-lysidine synthase
MEALFKEPADFKTIEHLPWYLALSAGMDSVVLLHALTRSFPGKLELIIHINHNLQQESCSWEVFCAELAALYDIKYQSYSLKLEGSSEACAREGRYRVFQDHLLKPAVLFMAHHGRDQVETVLWKVLRGSPLSALLGIPHRRKVAEGLIFRPLLSTSYDEIKNYAHQYQLTWKDDPTNQQSLYTRNFIRHEVLPVIKKKMPSVEENVLLTQNMLQTTQKALENLIRPYTQLQNQLVLENYPDQSEDGMMTLLMHWLTRHHYPYPSYQSLVLFVRQILCGKQPELSMPHHVLRVYEKTIFIHTHEFLKQAAPAAMKVALKDFPVSWGNSNIILKHTEQLDSFKVFELRALTKKDSVLIERGKKIKAQVFWKKKKIPPWDRARIGAFFHGKTFIQYENHCYNEQLFKTKPLEFL